MEEYIACLLEQVATFWLWVMPSTISQCLRPVHNGFLVRPSPTTLIAAQDLTVVEHLSEILETIGVIEPLSSAQVSRFG